MLHGDRSVAPRSELSAEHKCPGCKQVVHILCGIFDEASDKYVCKNCHPLSPSSDKASTPSTVKNTSSSSTTKANLSISTASTNPLANATMEDVLISENAINYVSINRKTSLTRLESIKGISIGKIELKILRLFCNQIGLKGQQKIRKIEICKAIVDSKVSGSYLKLQKEMEEENEKKKEKGETKMSKVLINNRRYLNVIFSDIVRPKLATLGEPLSKVELDAGLKKDQKFHELVVEEYNKSDVLEYGTNAFSYLIKGRSQPPSHFQPIEWLKSKDALKNLSNMYDECFQNWKHSGFHNQDIPTDVIEMTKVAKRPFADFSKNSSAVLYMHEFVIQFPNIMDKVTGEYLF